MSSLAIGNCRSSKYIYIYIYTYIHAHTHTHTHTRWGRDFPHPSRPALEPTQPPLQWLPGLSRWVKWRGRGVDHSSPSSVEVKETVELLPLLPLWAFVACYREKVTFYFIYIYIYIYIYMCVCVCVFYILFPPLRGDILCLFYTCIV